ncbi:MAG TPA: hypothetical protein VE753_06965 [Gaiellaceae bacterium]|jgi:hypothetical protein|nr:hypothetical protein [Gaiellaceae bacterium]
MNVFRKRQVPAVHFCDGCGSVCDDRCCARRVRERTLERAIESRFLPR